MDDQNDTMTVGSKLQTIVDEGDEVQLLEKKFETREELLVNVREFYSKKGYALSIKGSRRDKYVTLGFDRGGHYRDRVNIPIEHRQRKTSSRLINCPFEINGKVQDDGLWKVFMKNNSHNHEPSEDMCGHPSIRHFSKEELATIEDMTKSGIAPQQIISSLWQKNPNLQAISRNVYNAKVKINKETLVGRTDIQVLFEELGKGGFMFDIKRYEEGHLTHLFFAHPMSIKLSKSYSTVFVMDSTYKTNRFHMPLFEIIGITSFNTSFYSAFVFMRKKKEDYIWALEALKKMLGSNCEPSVVVTDRELALMNAIGIVFPGAANILCVWHIKINLVTNYKGEFGKSEELRDGFLASWNEIINCKRVDKFEEAWAAFELSYQEKGNVLQYIKENMASVKN